MPGARGLHAVGGTLRAMWMHSTQRLVPCPIAAVRSVIDQLVRTTWARATTVTTTEHHGRRSDWLACCNDPDQLDVVLTWTLVDLDESTFVTLTLDEMDPGPDPGPGLEAILDALAELSPVS